MLYIVQGITEFSLEVVADSEEEAKKIGLALLKEGVADLSHSRVHTVQRDETDDDL